MTTGKEHGNRVNHYPHHIGDFDKATRHLSRIERSIYRDLLDLYYDTEKPLPLDIPWLCRKIVATSPDESTAVEQVLNEFFTKTPAGWYQPRCEQEIDKYRTNSSQKAEAGRASAAKRALKRQQALNGNPTDVERTNHGASTNQNQEPEPRTRTNTKERASALDCGYSVLFTELWNAWPVGYGEKGSRKNAESAFLKIKPDKDLLDKMLTAISQQHMDKAAKAQSGSFFANFKHVERWLKNREWENEVAQFTVSQRKLSKSDEADRAFDDYRASLQGVDSGYLASPEGDGPDFIPARER